MKLGIIREGKNPPDNRVPLTPNQCSEVQQNFPGVEVVVQTSNVRCFSDNDYQKAGITVQEDMSSCDVLLGIKEVPVRELIPGKTYLFFSHTIKKQAYNRQLLQTILREKIRLIDYEVLTDNTGKRLIGFGRFAGLVGAYSGLRAFGLRNNHFHLKPAHQCENLSELFSRVEGIQLPPVKVAVTGAGRVAQGSLEILNHLKIKQLTPEEYLATEMPGEAVFTQLTPRHYVARKDGSPFDSKHFFNHPEMYRNTFLPYARSTDLLIAAAYWDPYAPVLFKEDNMRRKDFRIALISDITCDIDGSIPSTKKAATIAEPFYDFNPATGKTEPPFASPENITVQAVDNLPNELPRDASEDFGRHLIDKVFPGLAGTDPEGIIQRATVTTGGELTGPFSYLQDFAEGK